MRKIIQIEQSSGSSPYDYTMALCDDGTVWKIFNGNGERWRRLPDIPQEEKK
mgnify:CR=1 FL=1